MSIDEADIRVTAWSLPSSLESADADVFLTLCTMHDRAAYVDSGLDIFTEPPAETFVRASDQTHFTTVRLVAERGGTIVGFAAVAMSKETPDNAFVNVTVDPNMRTDESFDVLYRAAEAVAVEHGRSRLLAWIVSKPTTGAALVPASGFGRIPHDTDPVRAIIRAGYRLGQVERVSTLDLRVSSAMLTERRDRAQAAAGDDFAIDWWTYPTPEHRLTSYTAALQRMETDQPTGELVLEQETITPERVRHIESQSAAAGRTVAVTAAIHRPTGRIAAFNELSIGADHAQKTENGSTLVMPEHRGRRLGMLVKCAGLVRWQELAPDSPYVLTYNAEENRYMLDVNEAVGFVPVAYEGAFVKEIS